MQTRNHNTFTTIHTEGALLPVDLLQRISGNDKNLEGLFPESYHLAPGEKLTETINRSWNRLYGLWGAFQTARSQLGLSDTGTTLTRERWLLPLFQELGFGRLSTTKAVEIEGKSYPISHAWQNIPLHLVGCGLDLDKRTPGAAGAARTSPHSLLQEYLNQSEEAKWGVVTNGLRLRILRDNATLTRQAYIEFDLEAMFDGEVYSDFTLVWLICHQSRFENSGQQAECILERWSKSAQESGTRALDALRRGVEEAIVNLGQGFLQHPLNNKLRNKLKQGDLSAQDYYRQLLRLVYRLIFLFVAEDRDLLLSPDATAEARRRFQRYYSSAHLRSLAEKQRGSRHHDRYEALQLVMTLLGLDKGCPELALPALGGFLFGTESTVDLNQAKLDNRSLLAAVRSLAFITEGNIRRGVDYRNLGSEELGSVYEALLELHPLLNTDAGTFQLTSAAGNERKTTGSYYTPSSLITVLLDSALDPVINDRLKGKQDAAQQEQALLDLKVCDPASGSGHFLITAAHRIAKKLAEVRAGGDEPSPNENRRALRDVIRHCIYGVDINPMAVELCKVNLWLESLEPGKPLSFLDAHIKCGNSLVGVGPKIEIDDLEVPDEAFTPVTGDDRAMATFLKKRNRNEREGKEFIVTVLKTREDLDRWIAERSRVVEAMPEESAAEVQAKAQAYAHLQESIEVNRQRQVADFWTAAFFWKIVAPASKAYEIAAPTQGQLKRLRTGREVQAELPEQVRQLSRAVNFFHWPLEFAEVAAVGGFDCVLGNPPWERIKLQEDEFFAQRDSEIATAPNKAARQRLIDQLTKTNPTLAEEFEAAKHTAECSSKFVRNSGRYPLTAVGDVNTYALFAEHFRNLTSAVGRSGVIIPTGIATDDTTKFFFGDLVDKRAIASLYDFENKEAIFIGVHRSYKFCLLTLSAAPVKQAQFVFFATRVEHLRDDRRRFTLDPAEIAVFNPNTLTMPNFRTRIDAELTSRIFNRIPVLINEKLGINEWEIQIRQGLFHVTNDLRDGIIIDKATTDIIDGLTMLYEAKLIWQYDHRFSTYLTNEMIFVNAPIELPSSNKKPQRKIDGRYFVTEEIFRKRLPDQFCQKWFVVYRDVTNATNERTAIASVIPLLGVAYTLRVITSIKASPKQVACLLANINSIDFDYIARQSIGGMHLSDHIIKQLPIFNPNFYSNQSIEYISERVLELVYTSNDLKPFAEDMGFHGEPFCWNEERRATLRAELDAYYAKLYGLSRDELRYILDPQDVYGPDFPGETFRVLKEKEIRQYGEYRTRRLVLEAWERLKDVEIHSPSANTETIPNQPITIPLQDTNSSYDVDEEVEYPDNSLSSPTPISSPECPSEPTQMDWTDFSLYKCLSCGKITTGFDIPNHEQEVHQSKHVEWKKVK